MKIHNNKLLLPPNFIITGKKKGPDPTSVTKEKYILKTRY